MMEPIEILKILKIYWSFFVESAEDLFKKLPIKMVVQSDIYILCYLGILLTLLVILFVVARKKKARQSDPALSNNEVKARFRKRDRIRFYTTKMLRKVKQFKEDVLPGAEQEGKSVGKRRLKRRSNSNLRMLASNFLQFNSVDYERKIREPPAALLEADLSESTGNETHLPAEVMYMLKSVRIFGNFEKPLFFALCKHVVSMTASAGKIIFKPGQVGTKLCNVDEEFALIHDFGNIQITTVNLVPGDYACVSYDQKWWIGGSNFKYSIVIRAAVDSEILMFPSRAFKEVFEDHPESLVRVVQMIMLRLQQMIFQAFHKFLGLPAEIVSSHSRVNESLKSLSVYSLEKDEKKLGSCFPQKSVASSMGHSSNLISSIQEHESESLFTDNSSVGLLGQHKNSIKEKAIYRRTNSVELYGKTNEIHNGLLSTTSDFDAVLDRVGLEGSSEEAFQNQVTDDFVSSSSIMAELEVDESYGIPTEKEEKMMTAARADLVKLLQLPTPKLLDGLLTIDVVPCGTYLVKEGEKDSGLFFLVQGLLEVSQTLLNQKEVLFTCVPGEFMGSLSLLTGDPSFFTIYTKEVSYVVVISKVNFYKLIKQHPKVVLPVANSVIQKMSSFIRNIDFALDWILQESGKPLFRQNDEPDSLYIVLNGRLRAVRAHRNGQKEIVHEYGRGEFVGLVEALTHTERTESVHAIRDTELAQIPEGLLSTIKICYPQVVSRLIQLLGERLITKMKRGSRLNVADSKLERVAKNLGTLAVIPASNSVPLHNFTFELGLAISDIGSTLVLTSDVIKQRLGNAVLENIHECNLSNWLSHQEDIHRIVVYQADMTMTEWTKRCIRQADAIMIVGRVDEDPQVGKLEEQLERMTLVRAQKDLILLHDEESFVQPTNTLEWLNAREWVSAHYHIRCPKKIFKRKLLSERYANDPNYECPSKHSDFARLARVLTGTSIGLVLGGGGARGIAHIGVIKALREADIPIDSIGGTSMGAFVGALYAEQGCVVKTIQKCREGCKKMASMWRKILDMTYPYTSLFTGKAFNSEIHSTFGDIKIEDMLLPYFCVTTDINDSKMKIHQTGCCWRYVRASMSLSGYLPPMCDPVDGHLLLDGGYVNNLPGDVMRSLGVKTIICVDVGSEDEVALTNFGDTLSGWWMLWNKFNPFASPVRIPDMNGIQSRLAYVSCVGKLEEVKNSSFYNYIRPPINRFKTLQFGSFDEILECGYHHGKAVLDGLLKSDRLAFGASNEQNPKSKQITVHNSTAPSFTDLAELVSRIKPAATISTKIFDYYSEDDEDDEFNKMEYERATASDQECFTESYLSAPEEIGYESEDLSRLRRRRQVPRLNQIS
uniref:lysophospholipase n=1 Tax=Hydra vulgaris TaxID=6087 RepID=T2MAW3_HYDVU